MAPLLQGGHNDDKGVFVRLRRYVRVCASGLTDNAVGTLRVVLLIGNRSTMEHCAYTTQTVVNVSLYSTVI